MFESLHALFPESVFQDQEGFVHLLDGGFEPPFLVGGAQDVTGVFQVLSQSILRELYVVYVVYRAIVSDR